MSSRFTRRLSRSPTRIPASLARSRVARSRSPSGRAASASASRFRSRSRSRSRSPMEQDVSEEDVKQLIEQTKHDDTMHEALRKLRHPSTRNKFHHHSQELTISMRRHMQPATFSLTPQLLNAYIHAGMSPFGTYGLLNLHYCVSLLTDRRLPEERRQMVRDIIRALLEHGVNPNQGNFTKPLEEAIRARDVEVTRLLIEHGARIQPKDLSDAIATRNSEIVEIILNHTDPLPQWTLQELRMRHPQEVAESLIELLHRVRDRRLQQQRLESDLRDLDLNHSSTDRLAAGLVSLQLKFQKKKQTSRRRPKSSKSSKRSKSSKKTKKSVRKSRRFVSPKTTKTMKPSKPSKTLKKKSARTRRVKKSQ